MDTADGPGRTEKSWPDGDEGAPDPPAEGEEADMEKGRDDWLRAYGQTYTDSGVRFNAQSLPSDSSTAASL